ncbi:MAG: iron-containing alcohol dehydrogenase [Deltaproteobacteria bacterium]|nr:iron-containing alcohol dehydrogenase [Deltaproteobacteria bacterium]
MHKLFSFTGPKKIVFGNGSFSSLATQVKELGAKNPLILLDDALLSLGFPEKLKAIFNEAGLKYTVFSDIAPEPRLEMADQGASIAVKHSCDIVIGIGGGSAMDTGKAVAILITNGGKAGDYVGLNNVPKAGLPTIMVPTTAGTGSEATFTAVFINDKLKKKQGINSPFLYPDLALLDPLLTLSVPSSVTATTGVDALCHALESYTSIISSPLSEMFSLEAIQLIGENIRTCVHNGGDIEARSKMLLGSLYAGLGLANAGVTAVHSLSYPLGGRYGVPHGLANATLLCAVMDYNLVGALPKFAKVAKALGEKTDDLSVSDAAEAALQAVELLVADCNIGAKLQDFGVTEQDLPAMAKEAMEVARPLANNPRKLGVDDAVSIYQSVL